MTSAGSSADSDLSMRRRSLLLGGLGGASATALAALGHAEPAAAAPSPGPAAPPPPGLEFDFDNDNFHSDLIDRAGDQSFGGEQIFGPMDASLIIWIQHIMCTAWFDALAPYHRTAVGVHSRIPRRPRAESATNRNRNIAAIYATLQVIKAVYPERLAAVKAVMTIIGLDPEDVSENLATPVGIGNVAGKSVVRARQNDGMNFLGNEGPKYHGRQFEDYTGYEPRNTAYDLPEPGRWQPAMGPHRRRVGGGPGDKGIFIIQRFVTPHFGRVKPYTYKDPSPFKIARPDHTDYTDRAKYKKSADEILAASAALTDLQKVKTEFFDNKFLGIGQATKAAALSHNLDLDKWVQLHFMSAIAQLDDLIACWHQKRRWDAPRPFTVIRKVYGDRKVSSWGGVGKGTVHDMPGNEWTSFIPVGDHPEYPSGSTTLCAAEAQAARRFLGDDKLEWRRPIPKGSSLTEPGLVPARDLELYYPTWTGFVKDCATSRVWAGVHFGTTVARSIEYGTPFGDRAYDFAMKYIKGEVRA
ncbi:hypothetical protein LO762_03090 [Actinocorallia sp. API 0066]|uniref:DUF6851 domain-containing protein n=1 Tax=Actinocorallia sp. API 0066 TaxID=2896846 RepID=UPI001E5C25EA|nr:hypothetical protein [Actinocorallia sp. API 0066]MCD0448187.1 hypothetical protein [Actinocorallia sp. API 0066]